MTMNGQRPLLPQDLSLPSRRLALAGSSLVLSAAAVALLGGRDALAAGTKISAASLESDLRILTPHWALSTRRWQPTRSAPKAVCW
jgi:hypothetical protein